MPAQEFDIALVGGGLQSSLIALAVLARRPETKLALIESTERLGGNHTWSFHGTDVPDSARGWLAPVVVERWPRWEVSFPRVRRTFEKEYAAISSERLAEVVTATFAAHRSSQILLREPAVALREHSVELASGTTIAARLVVDARGPLQPDPASGGCAYQKFFGVELELDAPTITVPLVMNACMQQLDGFRFVYALPFAATTDRLARLLVEETYFSDSPKMDAALLESRALDWAVSRGMRVRQVLRTERGVLPLPLSWPQLSVQRRGPLVAGYRGGFFHPTTGYSFPLAIRVAEHLAAKPIDAMFDESWARFAAEHWRQARFAVLLNRLLFSATRSEHRRDVLERFHQLPEEVVLRFYALQASRGDRLRILCGRPPRGLSLGRAILEAVGA